MSRPDDLAQRNRVKLLAIVALFMLPPILAWVLWKSMDASGVDATTNAGTLVSPARPLAVTGLTTAGGGTLDDGILHGGWTYVMFASGGCDERCEQQLYLTRQIRVGMNKDMGRIRRLLVLDTTPTGQLAEQLAAEHEDLRWAVRGQDAGPLLEHFRGRGFGPEGEQYFLVDPLGNLMMYYDLGTPTRGIMKDLQKLLKISQIG